MSSLPQQERGFTIVELVIGLVVFSIVALSLLGLFTALVNSTLIIKRKAVALTLATNQMEYLKSLPYASLAVAGGSIVSSNPLPEAATKQVNGLTYTVKTSINYVDDAFDGCGSYPSQTLKETYCRNYPPPTNMASTVDQNPADYKIAHVSVTDSSNDTLAEVDTEIAARVAETSSTTGALFVSVIDDNGNPVRGATVQVTNTIISPAVNVSDNTDSNGIAIFYSLPPDTNGYDYTVTASETGYSTLATLVPSGSLQPTYPSQKIFTQQSSFVTMTIKPQGSNSLLLETVDTAGNPLPNAQIYVKGGYKKYTSTADTQYYYDNLFPSDARPITDSSGLAGISNLVPGQYILCGDNASTSCSANGITYYLAAAILYAGANSLNPINVPTFTASSPPSTTFAYNGNDYLQKVRLLLTTNPNFPRIATLAPYEISLTSGITGNFSFQITGQNLPCSSLASSCATSVTFAQASKIYTAACVGSSVGTTLNCTVDLSGIQIGNAQLTLSENGFTLNLPGSPLLGGLNVTP